MLTGASIDKKLKTKVLRRIAQERDRIKSQMGAEELLTERRGAVDFLGRAINSIEDSQFISDIQELIYTWMHLKELAQSNRRDPWDDGQTEAIDYLLPYMNTLVEADRNHPVF